jgi:hypothetical protein
MIQSSCHAGIEKFFLTGSKTGIQPKHAGHWSIWINGSLTFEDENSILVDYQDYQ